MALVLAVSTTQASAEILISDQAPRQGETLQVTVKAGGGAASTPAPTVTFHGQITKSYRLDSENVADGVGTYQALLAVPADLDPGKYTLKCGDEEKTLTVKSGLFPLQHISLPPAKDNFNMSPGEEEAVEGAKKTLSDARLWQGNFVPPCKARVSSGFGLKRMVNGRLLKDYFHSGIDYAGSLGSPVVACANGKVVLVGQGFKLHGNVVAIDHGQGVISFYIHLSKILVQNGQAVKEGERIGLVGRTGRATGPHLHYSLYVNKVAANPNDWFKRAF